MDDLFWSKLPLLPRGVKWPVKVVSWDAADPLVYCKSDNAYFSVSGDQLTPFRVRESDQLLKKGIAKLRSRPSTKKAFEYDVAWAVKEQEERTARIKQKEERKCRKKKNNRKKASKEHSDEKINDTLDKNLHKNYDMMNKNQNNVMDGNQNNQTDGNQNEVEDENQNNVMNENQNNQTDGNQNNVIDKKQNNRTDENQNNLMDENQNNEMDENQNKVIDENQNNEMGENQSKGIDENQNNEMGENQNKVIDENQNNEMGENQSKVIDENQNNLMDDNQNNEMGENQSKVIDENQNNEMGENQNKVIDENQNNEMGENQSKVIDENQNNEMGENQNKVIDENQNNEMGENQSKVIDENQNNLMDDNQNNMMAENQNKVIDENQNDMMDDNQNDIMIDENENDVIDENQNNMMAENQNNMMAENQNYVMAENQNNMMAENQNKVIDENQNDMMDDNLNDMMIDENENDVIDENQNNEMDENQNNMIGENKNKVIDENLNNLMDDNQNNLMGENQNKAMDENQNDMMDDNQNEMMIDENQNDVIDENQNEVINENQNEIFNEKETEIFYGNQNGMFDDNRNKTEASVVKNDKNKAGKNQSLVDDQSNVVLDINDILTATKYTLYVEDSAVEDSENETVTLPLKEKKIENLNRVYSCSDDDASDSESNKSEVYSFNLNDRVSNFKAETSNSSYSPNDSASDLESKTSDPSYIPSEESSDDELSISEDNGNDDVQDINEEVEKDGKFKEVVQEVLEIGKVVEQMHEEIAEESDDDKEPHCRKIPLPPDSCISDERYKDIYIKRMEKGNEKSKHGRHYDTVSACFYCNELWTNIQSHYERKHKTEKEVLDSNEIRKEMQLLLVAGNSNEGEVAILKKKLHSQLDLLRNKGNNKHNLKVIKYKKGELIIARRHPTFNLDDYGPCPECLEWFKLKGNFGRHKDHCPCNIDLTKKVALMYSNIIQEKIGKENSKIMKEEVFSSMRRDSVTAIALKDRLIIALGEIWFLKNLSNQLKRKHYASFHMRLAARLLSALKQKSSLETADMTDFLKPLHFDLMVQCSLEACDVNCDEELKHPSVAIKLGFDIARLAATKFTMCIKNGNAIGRREAKDFLKCLEMEWTVKVNTQARYLLAERQFNKKNELPVPSDIAKLVSHVQKEIRALNLETVNAETFRKAAVLAEARLLLYNRRRPGELSAITLHQYKDRGGISATDMSLRASFTKLEKYLLKSQDLVYVRGKGHKGVPIIVPPEVKPLLVYLTSMVVRLGAGIRPDSPYVFANTGSGVISGADALEVVKGTVMLEKPDLMKMTNLRKSTATVTQILSLSEQELKWLCNHLGHTSKVHDNHYRQTSGLIERLEVAKLMLIQEKNMVGQFAGRSLSDIQFEELEDEDEDVSESTLDTDEGTKKGTEEMFPEEKSSKRKAMAMLLEDDGHDTGTKKTKTAEDKKKIQRQKWSEEDETGLKRIFYKNFEMLKCPNTHELKVGMKKSSKENGHIYKRPLDNIKKKVSNMLIKLRT